MPEVETLTEWRPIPRLPPDDQKWTRARIEGGLEREGPFVERETVVLADYPDPADPPAFSFTTDQVDPADVWIRVVWLDALDNTSTAGARRRDGTIVLPLTVADLRDRSAWVRANYPAAPYSAQVEADLDSALTVATSLVESLTCRKLDESLAAEFVNLAIQASVWMAEAFLLGSSPRATKARLSWQRLKSISAGPWSESYFGPEEAKKAGMLSPDARFHDVLWALATEDCRDRWLELWGGNPRPAAMTTEIGWDAARRY